MLVLRKYVGLDTSDRVELTNALPTLKEMLAFQRSQLGEHHVRAGHGGLVGAVARAAALEAAVRLVEASLDQESK